MKKKEKSLKKDNFEVLTSKDLSKIKGGTTDEGGDNNTGRQGGQGQS